MPFALARGESHLWVCSLVPRTGLGVSSRNQRCPFGAMAIWQFADPQWPSPNHHFVQEIMIDGGDSHRAFDVWEQ